MLIQENTNTELQDIKNTLAQFELKIDDIALSCDRVRRALFAKIGYLEEQNYQLQEEVMFYRNISRE